MRPAEWRALHAFEPAWRERGEQGRNLVLASANANGLPLETAAEEIWYLMAGIQADALALQETKLLADSAERLRRALAADRWFARTSNAAVDERHRQQGMAIVLARPLANHILAAEEVRVAGPGEQPSTGTGLRLVLRFRQQRVLQFIVVYVPRGSENREVRDRTQQVARQWLADAAAPTAGPALVLLSTRTVLETLEALNWAVVEGGLALARKNSWRLTSRRDSNIRGFVLGAMLGRAPVMERQYAWYPQAYPEAEMRLCPRECGEVETQRHLFTCREVEPREPEQRRHPADRWAERAICAPGAHVAIPDEWLEGTANALAEEMRPAECTPQELLVLRDLTSDERIGRKLRERGRLVRKTTARRRWLYVYDEVWKPRNSLQLDREASLGLGPAQRRRLMRDAPRPPTDRVGGTPQLARTVDEGAYVRHCRIWAKRQSRGQRRVGGWCRGRIA
ncbi:hypothetical protein H4R21_000830 [Coemansia helicoidea]|uniref:Uncharacterized protein n=1 Tax=Coemansia helicoidea TaxID=1286919 RepID=A0ACC1LES9_9FUNG|nr:hypothetical protein H4R21_000830 [Coemansia helicoidea]